jgi:hypothetical protein
MGGHYIPPKPRTLAMFGYVAKKHWKEEVVLIGLGMGMLAFQISRFSDLFYNKPKISGEFVDLSAPYAPKFYNPRTWKFT